MNKRVLLIFLVCFFNFFTLFSQVSQDLVEKAKIAGISEEQIQQELKRMENRNNSSHSTDKMQNQISDREMEFQEEVDSLEKQQEINRPEKDLKDIVYGREIFTNKLLSFEPDLNIPTPKEYRLAAGDEILVSVWGDAEMNLNRIISPDGTIFIPDLGPVYLSGLTIEGAEIRIRNDLGRIIATLSDDGNNTCVSVSLGKIRSLKVNIVGEVIAPGTYTLPSFATIFNALYAAGGVNDIGTLRNIKLFRDSREIACLDVYEYLLHGKHTANVRLENNDMIMVGPYEQLITVEGHAKRNRIFELKKQETLQQLLEMAGGFTGDAYTEELHITRKTSDYYRIATVSQKDFSNFVMNDGDVVNISGAIPFYENRLTITGAVWRPGEYELTADVNSVKKLINRAKGLKGDEFANRAILTRLNYDFTTTLIPVDIRGIMEGTSEDIVLQNEDKLYISSHFDLREPYFVRIRGAVNQPGDFPYGHNMTIEDLVILAGGLKEAGSVINVEVARRIKNNMSTYSSNKIAETFSFILSEDLIIDKSGDIFTLEPFDEVYIRYSPEYSQQQVVQVRGEITFVGDYVLSEKNFRISDLIKKAGGLTPDAYIKGASLKRKVTEDEFRRLETLFAMSANQSGNDSISLSTIDIEQYSVGIDLQKALSRPGCSEDLVLQDGDELYIPQMQNTVKISGAVNYPNSVTFSEAATVKDYLSQSGGYVDNARKYPIVIYMNGMVATTKKKGIFFKKYPKVHPGSEIIIPERSVSNTKMSPIEIMSIASSTTSMAAMVTSIINTLSK